MKEEGDDEGLCFDGLEVALGCTVRGKQPVVAMLISPPPKVGTEFGDKLSMALMTCMGDDAEEATRSLNRRRGKGKGKGKGKKGKGKRGKGKGKGKGKGDDCPSVQDIETFIEEEMEGRTVMFSIYKRPQTRRPLCPLYDGLDQRRRRVQRRDFRS